MSTHPVHRWLCCLLVGHLLAGLGASAAGQVWVTALSEQGRVSINGMYVQKLTSSFKTKTEQTLFGETKYKVKYRQRWWNLTVAGPDRYAIRQDGKVSLNGQRIYELAFAGLKHHHWTGLAVTGSGLWALRSDGQLSLNGSKAFEFADGNYNFRSSQSDGTSVYHLRTDGAIFRDDVSGTLYRLNGGGADGDSATRTWRALAVDGGAGMLYALRADGKLMSARLDGSSPQGGVLEANLPFQGSMTDAKAWVDLTVRPDGRWLALRGLGAVRGPESSQALFNLPGTPENGNGQRYMRIVSTGPEEFAALRRDGRLYTGTSGSAVVNLRKGRYRALAVSNQPPDLEGTRNRRPQLMRCSATAVEGMAIEIPVHAVDVDMPVGDPQISIDPQKLPPGAVYDDVKRSIVWANPSPPGKYSIPVSASDGIGKPVHGSFKLRVRERDDATANRPPEVGRFRRVTALARQPCSLPVLASDRDGDALTIAVDETSMPAGASFDAATATLAWTPTYEQLGRHRVRFLVDDGTVVRTRSVVIRVRASLRSW